MNRCAQHRCPELGARLGVSVVDVRGVPLAARQESDDLYVRLDELRLAKDSAHVASASGYEPQSIYRGAPARMRAKVSLRRRAGPQVSWEARAARTMEHSADRHACSSKPRHASSEVIVWAKCCIHRAALSNSL